MSKKSIRFINGLSANTQKNYEHSIHKYEKYHNMPIDELIEEALKEQTEGVPHHLLKIIDRIEDFQNYLISQGLVYGTIQKHLTVVKRVYTVNRVNLPFIQPVNPKTTRRREYIEYKDILTTDEIKKAIPYMRLPFQARALAIAQGGLSNEECEHLSYRSFIDETYKYHQCDDDLEALKWLSDENHPIIWVTKMIRWKTKKPYYVLLHPEAINRIAEARLYQLGLPSYTPSDKLLDTSKRGFMEACYVTNRKCGFGLVAEESKFRSHNLRRFHATRIRGGVLSYEERSISNSQIDELQGRGKTSVQDTYIKTNPLEQKIIYAKVMNNLSLYNEYDYRIVDGDVLVSVKDQMDENLKLREEVKELTEKLEKKNKASEKVNALRDELGDDVFKELIGEILNAD